MFPDEVFTYLDAAKAYEKARHDVQALTGQLADAAAARDALLKAWERVPVEQRLGLKPPPQATA